MLPEVGVGANVLPRQWTACSAKPPEQLDQALSAIGQRAGWLLSEPPRQVLLRTGGKDDCGIPGGAVGRWTFGAARAKSSLLALGSAASLCEEFCRVVTKDNEVNVERFRSAGFKKTKENMRKQKKTMEWFKTTKWFLLVLFCFVWFF